MIISKQFNELKQAEQYQNRLYNKYSYVSMVQFPRFTESGVYKWNVRN